MHFLSACTFLTAGLSLVSAFPTVSSPSSTALKVSRDFSSSSYEDLEQTYGKDFMDYVGWVPGVKTVAHDVYGENANRGQNPKDKNKGGHKAKNGTASQPQSPGTSSAGDGFRPWYEPSCCELENTKLPLDGLLSGSVLPQPSGTLSHVLLGRGTQNYTCDHTNKTAVPVAVGAVAHLYNASCIAASSEPFLQHLTKWAFKHQLPSSDTAPFGGKASLTYVGRHYFTGGGVPTFDLNSDGQLQAKKMASADAPLSAIANSVSWLFLSASPAMGEQVDGKDQAYSGVYRVLTAGGNPPKTCKGQKKNIEVQYAATYWFYK